MRATLRFLNILFCFGWTLAQSRESFNDGDDTSKSHHYLRLGRSGPPAPVGKQEVPPDDFELRAMKRGAGQLLRDWPVSMYNWRAGVKRQNLVKQASLF